MSKMILALSFTMAQPSLSLAKNCAIEIEGIYTQKDKSELVRVIVRNKIVSFKMKDLSEKEQNKLSKWFKSLMEAECQ